MVTTLLPYGPEKPRAGFAKTITTNEIEIAWEPPKGGFTKYILRVDPNLASMDPAKRRLQTQFDFDLLINNILTERPCVFPIHGPKEDEDYLETELSNQLTEYKVTGLIPGRAYGIELKSKTGDRLTKRPVFEIVMTNPESVKFLTSENITSNSVLIKWVAPEENHNLRAYNLTISMSGDEKRKRRVTVMNNKDNLLYSFEFESMQSMTEYTITICTVCLFESMKTESEEEIISVWTLPEAPTNLVLENRSPNSFTVKWDQASISVNHRYRLAIESAAINYSAEYYVGGDRNAFNFSKLPDIIGTGLYYYNARHNISNEYVVQENSTL